MSYSNINRVVLVGRLTKDPELRELPSGQSVCNLRLACNGSRRDTDGELPRAAALLRRQHLRWCRPRTSAATCARAAASRSTGAWSGASGRPPSSSAARRSASSPTRSSSSTAPPASRGAARIGESTDGGEDELGAVPSAEQREVELVF